MLLMLVLLPQFSRTQRTLSGCVQGACVLTLMCAGRYVQSLVQKEVSAGIPANRIVVSGFSQVRLPAQPQCCGIRRTSSVTQRPQPLHLVFTCITTAMSPSAACQPDQRDACSLACRPGRHHMPL